MLVILGHQMVKTSLTLPKSYPKPTITIEQLGEHQ